VCRRPLQIYQVNRRDCSAVRDSFTEQTQRYVLKVNDLWSIDRTKIQRKYTIKALSHGWRRSFLRWPPDDEHHVSVALRTADVDGTYRWRRTTALFLGRVGGRAVVRRFRSAYVCRRHDCSLHVLDTGNCLTTHLLITINYCNKFRAHMNQAESRPVTFNSCNDQVYNSLFSMDELRDTIFKSHDTATGPDDIHYQMLKHLPPKVTTTLLNSLNNIWQDGDFPSEWHFANVIPILKPDKDKSDPCNYRPISLTSCICKIMERMVNSRLTW